MAYSAALCERLRDTLDLIPHITEKKMFGGLCFLYQGNMLCGIWKDSLILRLGEVAAKAALKKKHVKEFNITGKPMKNWVMIHEDDVTDAALRDWIHKVRQFVNEMPAK